MIRLARPRAGWLCAAALAAALSGCARQDGMAILGQWHAERFDLMGVKLPIGPELTIAAHQMAWGGSGTTIPINKIERDGDDIVLDTVGDIGLTFHMVDADRMYVQIPLLGDRIYYRRVRTAAAPARSAAAQAGPAVAQQALPVMPVTPAAAPPPRPAPYDAAYASALRAAGQGERDAALRYLYQAVREGFDRPDRLSQEPTLAALQSDPRYQVIVSGMTKH